MNTFNVCLGHLPFPRQYTHFIDLAIAPVVFEGAPRRTAIVPDELFGRHGHSLSEYAQLIWLRNHISGLAPDAQYVNIFHYRRFVSREPVDGPKSTNNAWVTMVREDEVGAYAACFERQNHASCFNTPVHFPEGVLGQYASAHVLEDMLNFVKYLMEIEMLDSRQAVRFLRYEHLVPACSVGIYEVGIFRKLFAYLERAAEFLNTPYFIVRENYQRRVMGFLLERLHSFLILEQLGRHGRFGHNMMISDSLEVTRTIRRVNG
jgi:hypothetical protein